jgi:hypothetical protein
VESRYSTGPEDGGRWVGSRYVPGDGAGGQNAVVIKNLRVVFQIQKKLRGKEPNSAEVSVYNLSERTRGYLAQPKLRVTLQAGSDGQLSQIYSGDLVNAYTNRENTDLITTLVLGDGHRAHNYAHVSKSFKPGVTAEALLEAVTKSMDVSIPTSFKDAAEMKKVFTSGFTLHGPSTAELDRLMQICSPPEGPLEWSVQDGGLQILRTNQVRADQAVVVSAENGMIDSPQVSPAERKSKPPIVTVSMLLRPLVAPGVKLHIVSKYLPNGGGNYKTENVTHDGDSWGGNTWTTSAMARAL